MLSKQKFKIAFVVLLIGLMCLGTVPTFAETMSSGSKLEPNSVVGSYEDDFKYVSMEDTGACAVTRSQAWATASIIMNHTWTLTNKNVIITDKTKVKLPSYIQTIVNQHKGQSTWSEQMRGIPYCWGGFMSMNTKSDGYLFDNAIAAGYTAGNIACVGSSYISGTAGLDCSGYASAVYGFTSKKGTGFFLTYGRSIEVCDMQEMDFFIKSGHIMMLYTTVGLEKNDVVICDVRTDSSKGKTMAYFESLSKYVIEKGYTARTPW